MTLSTPRTNEFGRDLADYESFAWPPSFGVSKCLYSEDSLIFEDDILWQAYSSRSRDTAVEIEICDLR